MSLALMFVCVLTTFAVCIFITARKFDARFDDQCDWSAFPTAHLNVNSTECAFEFAALYCTFKTRMCSHILCKVEYNTYTYTYSIYENTLAFIHLAHE